ncbi:MAG: SCO6745 family protein [Marmoricola sp.]
MTPERELWSLVEPVHAITYFAPPVSGCLSGIGLHGFWNGYFAGRAAPMGAVGPGPVTATFFGFAPAMVGNAVPKVWSRVSPHDVLSCKLEAAGTFLAPLLAELDDVDTVTTALVGAALGAPTDGRPLAAAWQSVEPPADPAVRLWWATTVIREHRGDGHVLAATHAALSGLETTLTHIASGVVTREVMQPNRGWTDDEWDEATGGLVRRGVLCPDGSLTGAGRELRKNVEADTDRLALPVLEAVGHELTRIRSVLGELGRAIAAGGNLPAGNPMGVPFPSQ